MRINEMFNGAPKAPSNDQPTTMYVEDSAPHLVVTYPGRFQPFHLGHRSVFTALQNRYGGDNVYIVTSNKTEKPKSPFNFSDKLAFFTAAGVPAHCIIESVSPYKLPSQFDYEGTILVIAVGAPDADRLRPGTHTQDGKPTYYQKFESLEKCKTADQHAYVLIAKERQVPITIGGKQYDASHGTECRNLWNKIRKNAKQRGEFLLQLFGRNDPELGRIMDKVDLDEAVGEVALPVDTISPIHGGTVKENTEPSDSDLFGDQSTIIQPKVDAVIDLFTNNVRGNLDSVLAEIGVERVDDIKNATDAHPSDIEFIIERVGLLKFLDALKRAFKRSKEDGINLLRTGWSELDPVVNFRGMTVHIPISEICDEFASELRGKHNVDITGLMWNNTLSESSEPNDEELFGKEKDPLVQAYELLQKHKSVYIQFPDNKMYVVMSVYVDERTPRRASDSVTILNQHNKFQDVDVNQDELSIIPYKNGHLLKKTVNENDDPTDDELFGKRYEDRIADGMEDYAKKIEDELAASHPSWADHEHTVQKKKEARSARQLGDIFRKGGVEAGKGMINALMSMPKYMWLYDLHDFMKYHRGIDLHDLYGSARRLEENEPNDDELFGNRPTALSPKDIVDGLRGYVNELQEYASKWGNRTQTYADYMAGILELNGLINAFERGGLRAGIPAFKELNREWNGEILVQLKNNYGVDLTKVLTRNSVSENSEPSDEDLFGDDYEVFDDPSAWTDYNGVMRRKRDIMRRDFLKDYTAPNGDIAIYLRNDDNQVVGAFYAPHNSKKRIGTFIKYGGAKTIEDYMANDPHCPFNQLAEDAAGVGVVKNSKDPRYVMATMGDQNDVTADTMPRQLRAYGLTGRKPPKLGRERR